MATATDDRAESVAADVQRAGKKLERAARKTRQDLERAERKAQKAAKREQKKLQADVTVEPSPAKRRKSGGLLKKAGLLLGVGAAAGAAYALRPTPETPLTLVPDEDAPEAAIAPDPAPKPDSEPTGQSGAGRHAAPESEASEGLANEPATAQTEDGNANGDLHKP